MTLLLECALVAVTIIGLALAMRHKTGEVAPMLLVGMVCWNLGLAVSIYHVAIGSTEAPHLGHDLWVASVPLVFAGILMHKGAHRTYAGPLMLFDTLLISFTWLMLIWKVCLYRPGDDGLADIHWPLLVVMFSELIVFSMVWLLAGNIPSIAMFGLGIGEFLLVSTDAFTFWAQGRPVELYWTRVGLMFVAVVVTGVSLACLKPPENRATPELERLGRSRGPLTMVLVAVPLAIYIVSMRDAPADAGSLVLSGCILLAFAGREIYRSRQSRVLLTALAGQALRDPLTGLANRRALEDALRHGGGASRLFVLTLDVDRFKDVNRQLGHSAGDRVLITVAEELTRVPGGTAFRLGGDEFALLLVVGTHDEAVAHADRLREAASESLAALPGMEPLGITVSLGIASSGPAERATDPLSVLTRSAQALRAAKHERNRVKSFSDADARKVEEHAELEQRLRRAVAKEEITYVYQPIVSLHDGKVVALEALARWHDPVLQTVSPAVFVPVAEQAGLVHDLGWQCLRSSARLQADLRSQGIVVRMSVNASPVQLRRATFHKDLLQLLDEFGLPSQALTLEVTEGVFIDPDGPAARALSELYVAGIGISIDDFGSGYSSLSYLTRLPADTIKVDKALTGRLPRPTSRAIVSALLEVAGAFGVSVVIEGVDTVALRDELIGLGARYAQGWLFAPGVEVAAVAELLNTLGVSPQLPTRRKPGRHSAASRQIPEQVSPATT